MRRYLLLTAFVLVGTLCYGATGLVFNTAGNLCSNLPSKGVTSVMITGTMDARDFKYIADSLDRLKEVNMANVTIVACETTVPLFGNQTSYAAGEIPATSFFGKHLTAVVLPARTTAIGYAAFAGCERLKSISLPPALTTIGSYAFSGTGLTSIAIPKTVSSVGTGAFARCASLASVSLPGGIVGDYAFLCDTMLSTLTLGPDIVSIGKGAFSGCSSLKDVDLTHLAKLERIGDEAFSNTAIGSVDLSQCSSLTTIGAYAFAGTQVASAKLGERVTAMGEGAFYSDNKLTAISMPTSMARVEALAFASTGLDGSHAVGKGVTSIGDYAYYNVDRVSTIEIPYLVNYIGTRAMAGMTGLSLIKAHPTTVPALGDSVWAGVDQAAVVLQAPTAAYSQALQWGAFRFKQSYMKGDVNNDGYINVSDITSEISYILGQNPNPFNFDAADDNGDGVVNVTDVTGLINIILSSSATAIRNAGAVTTHDLVSIPDFSIKPGQTRIIDVELSNAMRYAGLQCDIHLPESLHLVESRILPTSRSAGFTFVAQRQSDGTVRLLAYNMANHDFDGHDGAVLQLTVTAGTQLAPGLTVDVDDVVLATGRGEAYYPAATRTQVSSATGVDDVSASSTRVYARHAVLVIESNEPASAQLVAVNGTSTTLNVEAGHNEYSGLNAGFYIVRVAGKSFKIAIK